MIKRVWIPISLLLLLLILCSWQHRHSFDQPMHYRIVPEGGSYALKGVLKSEEEIIRFKKCFAVQDKLLDTMMVETDPLLESRGSVAVVEKILPLFLSQYKDGKIIYEKGRLLLSGKVESQQIKQEIQQLLDKGSVPYRNNTAVVKPQPIHFSIMQQKRKQYRLEGAFAGTKQKEGLVALFSHSKRKLLVDQGDIDPELVDREKILQKLEGFIPFFTTKIQEGRLEYRDGILYVGGKVMWKKRIEEIERLFRKLGIEGENSVTLNIKAIKGRRAKRKAKNLIKVLQKQRAKKEAIKKAEQEVSRDIVTMMETKNGEAQKLEIDNKKVRKNLKTLFETEIIEFNTAKTTLTPLGLGTVSKVAVILKAYPDVKIEIAGHTDSDGDDAFNMLLSQGRVNNVKRALMKEGIAKERINAVGYGETKPLVPNTTQANKQKNRRVEIIVIGE